MAESEITTAELDRWGHIVHPHGAPNWESLHRDDCRRLIAAYRESQAEVRRLQAQVALCPQCGCKLAEQALENPLQAD